jgi:hypothetical protein
MAADRLLSDGSGTALQRFSLILDMYDRLEEKSLLRHVRSAVGEVEADEIDGTQAGLCQSTLEQLASSLLPMGELGEAKRVVSAAIEKMLAEYGGSLVLEEIESVASHLYKYGWDQDSAGEAAREALTAYISDIDATLCEIRDLDELEYFERQLRTLMNEYGLYDSRAGRHISSHRESLLESYDDEDRGRYGRTVSPSQPQSSDDEIRSMFQGLLGP